jgi:hypothetical protein
MKKRRAQGVDPLPLGEESEASRIITNALNEIGDSLKDQGLTLDDMIERGRDIREELAREQYNFAVVGKAS